ncbi:MAG: hypothetical protein CVU56_16600 [Deltaproteobacteria bacterium HGW-Deltaproteobacteria-14]|jgi:hypothetical protein|nr:MAG: hypothetical protein CVU56_16600 [Deltaproteobacteria bacterium HGW-Deltaproteobacteria-14]
MMSQLVALALSLGTVWGGVAWAEGTPDQDPRNWPTVSRLIGDRYEVAGQVFDLRVYARETEYYNCEYRGTAGRLMAFTLLAGPYETLTGYMPEEIGRVLERVLEQDPWAPITVQVRFDPQRLSDLCTDQVDVLKWSRGWQYPDGSLTPGRPNTALQPTKEQLDVPGQRAMWKELRKLDSSYVGKDVQLTAGARVSTSYSCAFRGGTRTHFALRLHDADGRFIQAYLPRNERSRQLMDHIALHRDVGLAVQGRVVKLAMSSYCRPQLEVTSWSLLDSKR